jgi:hypothetical protein
LGYIVEIIGDPDRIRTCDPQIRNLMLYPAELRGRSLWFSTISAAEASPSPASIPLLTRQRRGQR